MFWTCLWLCFFSTSIMQMLHISESSRFSLVNFKELNTFLRSFELLKTERNMFLYLVLKLNKCICMIWLCKICQKGLCKTSLKIVNRQKLLSNMFAKVLTTPLKWVKKQLLTPWIKGCKFNIHRTLLRRPEDNCLKLYDTNARLNLSLWIRIAQIIKNFEINAFLKNSSASTRT